MAKSERELMLEGKLYSCNDPELLRAREKAEDLCFAFNHTLPSDPKRREILAKLAPNIHPNAFLRGPFYCDYGTYIEMGEGCYANWNLTVLDVCPVKLGKNVFMGPNVTLCTAEHPLVAKERMCFLDPKIGITDLEYGKPISIGDGVWLGEGVTVLGGVHIGENSVIGAGSLVTHDIPANTLAYGVPAKAIRKITEKDELRFHPELFDLERK